MLCGAIFESNYFPSSLPLHLMKKASSLSSGTWLVVVLFQSRCLWSHVFIGGVFHQHLFYFVHMQVRPPSLCPPCFPWVCNGKGALVCKSAWNKNTPWTVSSTLEMCIFLHTHHAPMFGSMLDHSLFTRSLKLCRNWSTIRLKQAVVLNWFVGKCE